MIIGGLGCIYMIATYDMTARENALIGVILAIMSILGSWIVTHVYSQIQHKKSIEEVQEFHRNNLKTYAKKAAEKVNNLSKELGRLATYLAEELNRNDIDNQSELLLSREERMTSAIHLVNTLKSVNDTSLSDWEGVIDDLLEKQKEEKIEKEEEIYELINRLDPLLQSQLPSQGQAHSDNSMIRSEIEDIKNDLKTIMAANFGVSHVVTRKSQKRVKKDIENKCPTCGEIIVYRQRPLSNSCKALECNKCNTKFLSRYSAEDGSFFLEKRELNPIAISCPKCGVECKTSVDPYPQSSVRVDCGHCRAVLRITQKANGGLAIKSTGMHAIKTELTEELLASIKEKFPPQPWPKGIHRTVAQSLNISPGIVWKATDILIRRGDFMPQFDGVLYKPLPPKENQKKSQPDT
jgi:hypothetical protein